MTNRVPFYNIFKDCRKEWCNLPMYQSGSGGENAIVLIGKDFILMFSTHDEYDLLATVMLKWKLEKVLNKFEQDYRESFRNLLKGEVDGGFGDAFLNSQDVLYENGVIIYESCLKDVTPE